MKIDDSEVQFHTLKNGIRLVHIQDSSTVAYCGFAINVGTRDEEESELGMAHFIEHMLFKGTEKRKPWHILNRLESVGGEINAYTTKEETYVYATVLCADFERAMELCSDIVFHSKFPQNEIDKEVDVIIDEIHSYRDTPSELIYDDFEDILFEGYSIGRDILGDAKRLRKYTTKDALRFVERTYCTDEILFFSLGNINFKKISNWADKYFGDVPEKRRSKERISPNVYIPKKVTIKKNTHQAHVMIGNRAYDLQSDNRLPLYLLNNILGGPGMNSRLNLALREKNGMAYNVESLYTSYSDTGLFSIYFGTDEKNREKCMNLIFDELYKFCKTRLTDTQLTKAKKQLMGQLAISQENKENLVLSLAKSFLFFNKFESLSDVETSLNEVTPSLLLDIANEIFQEDRITILNYKR